MSRCKITILKRNFDQEIVDKYVGFDNYGKCEYFKEGEVYYSSGEYGNEMPKGFCEEAWKAINAYSLVMASGGTVFGQKRCITCCNDGARPVVFMLESCEDK